MALRLITADSPVSEFDSERSKDVEFLYETCEETGFVIVDNGFEEDGSITGNSLGQTPAPVSSFRFLDLPAELRCHVYSFLLPHDLTITFEKYDVVDGQPVYDVLGRRRGETSAVDIGGNPFYLHAHILRDNRMIVETQLFRVNKLISKEALAVLYGTNTYKFIVHGKSLWPKSLRSPHIFGSLGHPIRLPLLRNLRRIHIEVVPDVDSHWAVKRQRARLEYLVEILKEYSDDDNQKSLLQELTVDFKRSLPRTKRIRHWVHPRYRYPRGITPERTDKFIFGLESLASLRGIKDVRITGLPEWYTECMQLSIQGKGGELQMTDWPLLQITRRTGTLSKHKKKRLVTSRKWYQPTLNWKEFALRNGIPIPDDIDKFWARDD